MATPDQNTQALTLVCEILDQMVATTPAMQTPSAEAALAEIDAVLGGMGEGPAAPTSMTAHFVWTEQPGNEMAAALVPGSLQAEQLPIDAGGSEQNNLIWNAVDAAGNALDVATTNLRGGDRLVFKDAAGAEAMVFTANFAGQIEPMDPTSAGTGNLAAGLDTLGFYLYTQGTGPDMNKATVTITGSGATGDGTQTLVVKLGNVTETYTYDAAHGDCNALINAIYNAGSTIVTPDGGGTLGSIADFPTGKHPFTGGLDGGNAGVVQVTYVSGAGPAEGTALTCEFALPLPVAPPSAEFAAAWTWHGDPIMSLVQIPPGEVAMNPPTFEQFVQEGQGFLGFHRLDAHGIDRSQALAAVMAGDTVVVTAESGEFIRMLVQDGGFSGDWLGVSGTLSNGSGTPPVRSLCTVTFTYAGTGKTAYEPPLMVSGSESAVLPAAVTLTPGQGIDPLLSIPGNVNFSQGSGMAEVTVSVLLGNNGASVIADQGWGQEVTVRLMVDGVWYQTDRAISLVGMGPGVQLAATVTLSIEYQYDQMQTPGPYNTHLAVGAGPNVPVDALVGVTNATLTGASMVTYPTGRGAKRSPVRYTRRMRPLPWAKQPAQSKLLAQPKKHKK